MRNIAFLSYLWLGNIARGEVLFAMRGGCRRVIWGYGAVPTLLYGSRGIDEVLSPLWSGSRWCLILSGKLAESSHFGACGMVLR